MIPRARIHAMLREQGLTLTKKGNEDLAIWHREEDDRYFLIRDHAAAPPSVVHDMLAHIVGIDKDRALVIVDELVYKAEFGE